MISNVQYAKEQALIQLVMLSADHAKVRERSNRMMPNDKDTGRLPRLPAANALIEQLKNDNKIMRETLESIRDYSADQGSRRAASECLRRISHV